MPTELLHEITGISFQDCQDALQAVVEYFRTERELPWQRDVFIEGTHPSPPRGEVVRWQIDRDPFIYLDLAPGPDFKNRIFMFRKKCLGYYNFGKRCSEEHPGIDIFLMDRTKQRPDDTILLPGGKYAIRTGFYTIYGDHALPIVGENGEYSLSLPGSQTKTARK